MNILATWSRLQKSVEEPVDAIERLSRIEAPKGLWPFVAIGAASGWSKDTVRGVVACHLEQDYDEATDWLASITLLLAPFPREPAAFLDLLSLAHRVLRSKSEEPHSKLLRRAATLLFRHALKQDGLVSFEAANVLGGVIKGVLGFSSKAEKSEIDAALARVRASLRDSGLAEYMGGRSKPALSVNADWSISTAEIESFHAQVNSRFASYLQSHEVLTSLLSHTRATLRAFAESQEKDPFVIGAGSVRVRPRHGDGVDTGALAAIQAFVESLAELGGAIFAKPMLLAEGSVEIVFRFHAEDLESDESSPSLALAADRIDEILSPDSEERIPPGVAALFDLVWRKSLRIDVSLRLRDGSERTVVVDRERVDALNENESTVRRKGPDVESIDVPQADDLDRVFRIVELLAEGNDLTVKGLGIRDAGEVTAPRQIGYYRHAARILGLIERFGGLTASGLQIASLKDRKDRLRRAVVFFEQSVVGRAWLDWSCVETAQELDGSMAEKFLEERTKVGGATRRRRAGTLQRWLAEFKAIDTPAPHTT